MTTNEQPSKARGIPGKPKLCYWAGKNWVRQGETFGPAPAVRGPERQTPDGAIRAWNKLLDQLEGRA